jgi:diguanylate cyclase (GGDEF)-like protein
MWGSLVRCLAGLAICFCILGAQSLRAEDGGIAPTCHAFSDISAGYEDIAEWHCDNGNWSNAASVGWLRFNANSWSVGEAPRLFVTRNTVFERLDLLVVETDGSSLSLSYTPGDVKPLAAGPLFSARLPNMNAETAFVAARIVRPHNVTILTDARLAKSSSEVGWSASSVILLAFICGMLVVPLLFNVNFYIVLHERFILLHAVMVVAMLTHVALAGGLLPALLPVGITFLAIAGPLSWALGVGTAAFFSCLFLEPDALSERMRRTLKLAGCWTMLVTGFFALQLPGTQTFSNSGYFVSFIPVIAIFVASLAQAWLRGSKAARFLVAAWVPIILASVERLLRGLGIYAGPSELDLLLFLGMALEILIIALGVGNRVLAVKHERDLAQAEAQSLELLAERDPLTGLMNRRAIEPRFAEWRMAGFETLAVLDLDYFKEVNDMHGHAVGDEVLRLVAKALAPDPDTLVSRLGGEEFVLLLRGKDARERAETRRRSLSVRIARELEGLDRVVTASMGLVQVPEGILPDASFKQLYTHADRLLYEAKAAGRNRTVYEQLKAFNPRPNRAA